MAVTKTSFLGSTAGDGAFNSTFATQTALFLKLFAGEVLTAYETATVMKPLHTMRTITSGKSAQFPVTGIASASYHKPGTDIAVDDGHTSGTGYTSAIKHNEKVINIDDLLIASTFVDKLDEMRNHYDVRSIYSSELGRALARAFDKNLLGVACLTAATYNASTGAGTAVTGLAGNPNGTIILKKLLNDGQTATASTNGDIPNTSASIGISQFVGAMYDAAAQLDKNNVPPDDRYCIVTPGTFYTLINSDYGRLVVNRDFGGGGSYQEAKLAEIAGIRLVKSNIATTVFGNSLTAATGANNTYTGNFKRVCSVVFHKSAFGTVKLQDLSMESGYDMRLQGHLMIAKYAMGSAPLRPECACVIVHDGTMT